jgi:hypothetical protein
MPGDYAALRAELLKPDLAALSHADAAAKLRSDLVSVDRRYVPIKEIERVAYEQGVVASLAVGADSTNATVRGLSRQGLEWMRSRSEYTDMSLPAVTGFFDALVAATLITTTDRDLVLALRYVDTPRDLALPGWELPVTAADVAKARS